MADIDMTGIDWTPWDFSGKFDGNGYTILNLSVTKTNRCTMKTYDGNRKEYDTIRLTAKLIGRLNLENLIMRFMQSFSL